MSSAQMQLAFLGLILASFGVKPKTVLGHKDIVQSVLGRGFATSRLDFASFRKGLQQFWPSKPTKAEVSSRDTVSTELKRQWTQEGTCKLIVFLLCD